MSTKLAKTQQDTEVAGAERTRGGTTFSPRIDIWENSKELILHADLPGVAPEGLDVEYEDGELMIHGKAAPRHEDAQSLYGEYDIGDFHRTFVLGESIDTAKISAELNGGVLTLHLPKAEQVKSRRIAIKAS